jgi:hypothetical protein
MPADLPIDAETKGRLQSGGTISVAYVRSIGLRSNVYE